MSKQLSNIRMAGEVTKVDDELGLVFGWAIICTKGGEAYFDVQGDHIPEDSMLKAATEFMADIRVAKEMHVQGEVRGEVIHSMPLTAQLAKAFGITTDRTGFMIGMRPDAAMLKRFKDGELRGFSIGGRRVEDEDVEDES